MIFSNTHLNINVMKVPSRSMMLPLPASFNGAICFEIVEDSFNRPDGYTTIDGYVFFFEKQRHSHNDLLYLDRDFATLCHLGGCEDAQKCQLK
jgi:hypothetical protein